MNMDRIRLSLTLGQELAWILAPISRQSERVSVLGFGTQHWLEVRWSCGSVFILSGLRLG